MPWTVDDVDRHKKGLSATQKRQWVDVANGARAKCLREGGTEAACDASAIRQANGVVGHSEIHELQTDRVVIRTTIHEGRRHLIIPVVMMVEGVHNGSHGRIFHPAAELGRFPQSWNGIPVTINHPRVDGVEVSANQPEIIDGHIVGRIYNTQMDGTRLRAEAWIDEARITNLSPEALAYINAGHPLDVSVGVFSDEDETPGTWNNEAYIAVARNHRPDHLALLPGGTGACSWADGCGVRTNEAFEPPESGDAPAEVKRILREVYSSCRTAWVEDHPSDRENAGNKTSCSRIAWHAVHQAGWRKGTNGQWTKISSHEEGGDSDLDTYALHYSGTESTPWSGPSLADFGVGSSNWSELSASDRAKVAGHFLIGSASAGSFGDLKLPVVNPRTGKLNEHALRAVISGRGAQVGGVSAAERSAARRRAYELLNKEFDAKLTIPSNLEETIKDLGAEGYAVIQFNVDMGYRELLMKVQAMLDRMDNDNKIHFLQELYKDNVIYEVRGRDGQSAFYRQNYQLDDKGNVSLIGNATRVIRQIQFVNANAEKGAINTMSGEKKTPCCPAKVELLIQSKVSHWQETDRDWLSGLDEPQINRLVELDAALVAAKKKSEEQPQLNKEQAIQQLRDVLSNPDQFINLLAPELQEQMRSGMQLHREKRAKLIQALVAASPKKFTEDKLKDRSMEALEELVSLIPNQPDFSAQSAGGGALGGSVSTFQGGTDDILLPAGVEIKP